MKKNQKSLIRIIVSLALFSAGLIAFKLTPLSAFESYAEEWKIGDFRFYAYVLPFIAAYLIVGYDVVLKAGRNLFSGRLLDENFLMTVATFGAIALCDFPEACGVMLFYQVGELFQSYAVGKSRKSIAALMDIRPPSACVLRGGEETTVSPEDVAVGEIIIVRAGERVPVDGVVVEGSGSVDASSLTGESLPRDFSEGDEILSGSINLNGVIKIRATKVYTDSTVAKILNLVENASARKARTENFITKFARVYTPAVVAGAAIIALLPPVFAGNWAVWINRGLTFLVVSCPCALVISVPLSFFGGIGAASKAGVLVKGGNYLELLAKADTFVFDKTGTLTEGSFGVTEIYPASKAAEVLRLAAIAESGSIHPIAQSIVRRAGRADSEGYT
ncbi:MAG: HAD-IC family P-type ATPase, partial [Clostridia bacterium]|nr:HAD-IC family P-type ATPase [Clostridia bacterium]